MGSVLKVLEKPTDCASFGGHKLFQGERYSLFQPGSMPYYRNTRTHRKLSHDVYEYYSGIVVPHGYVVHHKDENSLNSEYVQEALYGRLQ